MQSFNNKNKIDEADKQYKKEYISSAFYQFFRFSSKSLFQFVSVQFSFQMMTWKVYFDSKIQVI